MIIIDNIQYATLEEAAKMKGLGYEAFRWWVRERDAPKPVIILGRKLFKVSELNIWNPERRRL